MSSPETNDKYYFSMLSKEKYDNQMLLSQNQNSSPCSKQIRFKIQTKCSPSVGTPDDYSLNNSANSNAGSHSKQSKKRQDLNNIVNKHGYQLSPESKSQQAFGATKSASFTLSPDNNFDNVNSSAMDIVLHSKQTRLPLENKEILSDQDNNVNEESSNHEYDDDKTNSNLNLSVDFKLQNDAQNQIIAMPNNIVTTTQGENDNATLQQQQKKQQQALQQSFYGLVPYLYCNPGAWAAQFEPLNFENIKMHSENYTKKHAQTQNITQVIKAYLDYIMASYDSLKCDNCNVYLEEDSMKHIHLQLIKEIIIQQTKANSFLGHMVLYAPIQIYPLRNIPYMGERQEVYRSDIAQMIYRKKYNGVNKLIPIPGQKLLVIYGIKDCQSIRELDNEEIKDGSHQFNSFNNNSNASYNHAQQMLFQNVQLIRSSDFNQTQTQTEQPMAQPHQQNEDNNSNSANIKRRIVNTHFLVYQERQYLVTQEVVHSKKEGESQNETVIVFWKRNENVNESQTQNTTQKSFDQVMRIGKDVHEVDQLVLNTMPFVYKGQKINMNINKKHRVYLAVAGLSSKDGACVNIVHVHIDHDATTNTLPPHIKYARLIQTLLHDKESNHLIFLSNRLLTCGKHNQVRLFKVNTKFDVDTYYQQVNVSHCKQQNKLFQVQSASQVQAQSSASQAQVQVQVSNAHSTNTKKHKVEQLFETDANNNVIICEKNLNWSKTRQVDFAECQIYQNQKQGLFQQAFKARYVATCVEQKNFEMNVKIHMKSKLNTYSEFMQVSNFNVYNGLKESQCHFIGFFPDSQQHLLAVSLGRPKIQPGYLCLYDFMKRQLLQSFLCDPKESLYFTSFFFHKEQNVIMMGGALGNISIFKMVNTFEVKETSQRQKLAFDGETCRSFASSQKDSRLSSFVGNNEEQILKSLAPLDLLKRRNAHSWSFQKKIDFQQQESIMAFSNHDKYVAYYIKQQPNVIRICYTKLQVSNATKVLHCQGGQQVKPLTSGKIQMVQCDSLFAKKEGQEDTTNDTFECETVACLQFLKNDPSSKNDTHFLSFSLNQDSYPIVSYWQVQKQAAKLVFRTFVSRTLHAYHYIAQVWQDKLAMQIIGRDDESDQLVFCKDASCQCTSILIYNMDFLSNQEQSIFQVDHGRAHLQFHDLFSLEMEVHSCNEDYKAFQQKNQINEALHRHLTEMNVPKHKMRKGNRSPQMSSLATLKNQIRSESHMRRGKQKIDIANIFEKMKLCPVIMIFLNDKYLIGLGVEGNVSICYFNASYNQNQNDDNKCNNTNDSDGQQQQQQFEMKHVRLQEAAVRLMAIHAHTPTTLLDDSCQQRSNDITLGLAFEKQFAIYKLEYHAYNIQLSDMGVKYIKKRHVHEKEIEYIQFTHNKERFFVSQDISQLIIWNDQYAKMHTISSQNRKVFDLHVLTVSHSGNFVAKLKHELQQGDEAESIELQIYNLDNVQHTDKSWKPHQAVSQEQQLKLVKNQSDQSKKGNKLVFEKEELNLNLNLNINRLKDDAAQLMKPSTQIQDSQNHIPLSIIANLKKPITGASKDNTFNFFKYLLKLQKGKKRFSYSNSNNNNNNIEYIISNVHTFQDLLNMAEFAIYPINCSVLNALAYMNHLEGMDNLLSFCKQQTILLDFSCDIQNKTALDICLEANQAEMLKLLLKYIIETFEWEEKRKEILNSRTLINFFDRNIFKMFKFRMKQVPQIIDLYFQDFKILDESNSQVFTLRRFGEDDTFSQTKGKVQFCHEGMMIFRNHEILNLKLQALPPPRLKLYKKANVKVSDFEQRNYEQSYPILRIQMLNLFSSEFNSKKQKNLTSMKQKNPQKQQQTNSSVTVTVTPSSASINNKNNTHANVNANTPNTNSTTYQEETYLHCVTKYLTHQDTFYGSNFHSSFIQYCWEKFAMRIYKFNLISFMIFLVLLSVQYLFLFPISIRHKVSTIQSQIENEQQDYAILQEPDQGFFVLNIILLLFLSMLAYRTIFKDLQLFSSIKEFLRTSDSILVFDMLTACVTYLGLVYNFLFVFDVVTQNWLLFKLIIACMMLLQWLKIIFYMRGSDKTAFYIRIIIKIIFNIKYFMLILICVLLSVAFAIYLLNLNVDEGFVLWFYIVQGCYLQIMGDSSLWFTYINNPEIPNLYFILEFFETICLYTVVMTLLIAIIQDTYDQIKPQEVVANNYERTTLIHKTMLKMDAKERQRHINGYFHSIKLRTQNDMDQNSGYINEQLMRQQVEILYKNTQKFNKKINQNVKNNQSNIDIVKREIHNNTKILNDVIQNQKNMLSTLLKKFKKSGNSIQNKNLDIFQNQD